MLGEYSPKYFHGAQFSGLMNIQQCQNPVLILILQFEYGRGISRNKLGEDEPLMRGLPFLLPHYLDGITESDSSLHIGTVPSSLQRKEKKERIGLMRREHVNGGEWKTMRVILVWRESEWIEESGGMEEWSLKYDNKRLVMQHNTEEREIVVVDCLPLIFNVNSIDYWWIWWWIRWDSC